MAKKGKSGAPPIDFFDAAASLPVKGKKADAKKNEDRINTDGLLDYAVLSAAEKAIKAIKEVQGSKVKGQMRSFFVQEGNEKKRKPENYKGIDPDGIATASLQLRKRGEQRPLSDEEIENLKEEGIPFDEVVVVPETFIVNPKYKDDAVLKAKLNEALGKVAGLPSDFLLRQPGVTKVVISEDTENALFKLPTVKVRLLLDTVFELAIRSSIDSEKMDTAEIFTRAKKLVIGK